MIESLVLGILSGLISGVIPGVGNFVAVLLFFPVLITWDPIHVIVFYVALTSISQYIGSIPAIVLGVPGESSSMPAVIESKHLSSQQDITNAIAGSALGSMYGSFIVVALCFLLKDYFPLIFSFYNTTFSVILFTACSVLLCYTCSGGFAKNFVFLFVGFFIGAIGHISFVNQTFMTFGNTYLFDGIPLVVVTIMLFDQKIKIF